VTDENTEDKDVPAAEPAAPWEIKDVSFEKSASRRSHFPREPRLPQVAFVGRSNVGKSSLLNVLVNRKRMAHVSRTPGRTQLVNFFIVNGTMRLVDLPGYGFARAPKEVKSQWDQMITGYLLKNRELRLVVTLFDMRRDPTPEDETLLDWLNHYEIPFLAVLTKADKLTRSAQRHKKEEMAKWLSKWQPKDVLLFSALSRDGRQDVLNAIGAAL
jgi:GTP-binding protein